MVGSGEEDPLEDVRKLKEELEKTIAEVKEEGRRRKEDSRRRDEGRGKREEKKRDFKDVVCYGCGEKGHFKRSCPKSVSQDQGNGSRRLDQQ